MIQIPLLLTATVNPRGMAGANFNPKERAEMYVEALRFYISKGCRVVFAENSDSIDLISDVLGKVSNVEFVDVSGLEYDQLKGKGYNETIMLHKAVVKSKFIKETRCFFKITGRLKVLNILSMLEECCAFYITNKTNGFAYSFLADCKDHDVYKWLHLPINGHSGECRYWFATTEFFESQMWPRCNELNDYEPHIYLAEDLMLDVCRKTRGIDGCRDRFRTQAHISGKGGHNLGKGWSFFYSTDNDSFALRAKCFLRQILRWTLPWWRC